jgi:hypothetical protein
LRERGRHGLSACGQRPKKDGKLTRPVYDGLRLPQEGVTERNHGHGNRTCGPTQKLSIR